MPKGCPECGGKRHEVLAYVETSFKHEELDYTGSCDGIVQFGDEEAVFEFKTISASQYPNLHAPKPEHVVQVHAYMAAGGYKVALIVYQNKGKTCAWTRSSAGVWKAGRPNVKAYLVRFDDDLWLHMKKRVIDWHKANEAVKKLPVVSDDDVTKHTRICAHPGSHLATECSFREECFKLPR